MNSIEARKKFLDYFEKNGHTVVSSSSLIPAEDPTLLFTNAGMNQFKDLFLGKEKRSYTRAVTIQKCVRAGGKHNDLDQVGYTERHLTFFEMMGNFSFGDFFKKEAIAYAWEFLTQEVYIDPKKLWVSVYKDDQESFDIWRNDIGVNESRIVKLGEVDNFWSMGDIGPCGPCTEIYLDRGSNLGCKKNNCAPGCICERFIEIWNNVFMQYNKQSDGTMKNLDQTGVDTGMGLERLCMVLQNKNNVFEIDQFQSLISKIEKLTNQEYLKSTGDKKAAFHVLSDHARTSALLIADGCNPSNDGRGYVLRKIIRRAALFCQKLTTDKDVFVKLVQIFINQMGNIYPELNQNNKLIIKTIDSEINKFSTNLLSGKNILDEYINESKNKKEKKLTGKQVFKLYDTYGFPPELTEIIAKEEGLIIDRESFEEELEKAKEISGKKMKDVSQSNLDQEINNLSTIFVGYDFLENESNIQFIKKELDCIWISTKESPFYVASGGQDDDKGTVLIDNQIYEIIELKKVGQTFNPTILLKLKTKNIPKEKIENINIGSTVQSKVDKQYRFDTVKNHTATHMLQAALYKILGSHVKQSGSFVNNEHLRFDFTNFQAMNPEEIKKVELLVNKKIQENIALSVSNKTLSESKKENVTSFFGEKYNPENVRIVDIPGFSKELCGGTHAPSTGIIGSFKIISESALSTGVRRIFAITGQKAIEKFQEHFCIVKTLGEVFKVKDNEVISAVKNQQDQLQASMSQIKALQKENAIIKIPLWKKDATIINNITFLYIELENHSNDILKIICQNLDQSTPGFYILLNKISGTGNFNFMAFVSKQYKNKINIESFGIFLKENFGIKSGGRENVIQGGGTKLQKNIESQIIEWLKHE